MSNYIRWTQHPDTMEWHNAAWLDNHFGEHLYGVQFNDGTILDPREVELKVRDEEPEGDEVINASRDQYKEMFGDGEVEAEPVEGEEPPIPTRRVRFMMVNPADFMFLFTKGIEFRKHTKLIDGLPTDATLIQIMYDGMRGGVQMVVESQEYDEIPINEMPPVQPVKISTGVADATKKKRKPRKK